VVASRHLSAGDGFVVNRDSTKQWQKYFFYDGFSTNIDLWSPNKVGKCRDEIWFYREFINLGTDLHNCWRRIFLKNLLNPYLGTYLHNY
jgi:hypothetical protein